MAAPLLALLVAFGRLVISGTPLHGLPEDQVTVTSAKTGEGIADLKEAIAGLISGVAQ